VLCYDSVILELKALGKVGDVEIVQILNHLKAGRQQRGLLINFEPEACSTSALPGPMRQQANREAQKEICVI
jgi:GxxExxY protein